MHLLSAVVTKDVAILTRQQEEGVLKFYNDYLPSLTCMDSEHDLWKHKWKSDSEDASELDSPEKTLAHTMTFPQYSHC